MGLLLPAAVSGIAIGMLYGLLAFSVVLLFKATGIANFAQGNIATFCTFLVYLIAVRAGWGLPAGLALGVIAAVLTGLVIYLGAMRVNDSAGSLNLVVRALAVYLLLTALMTQLWGPGQPFAFPSLFPAESIEIAGVFIPIASIGFCVISVILAFSFWLFFRRTNSGLLLLGMAEQPDVAKLLGVDTRRLTAISWAVCAVVSMVVGVLVAPTAFLYSDMMDLFLLYAFVAAVVGGFTSLYGTFVGGVLVGVIQSVFTVTWGADFAVLSVFALLIGVLIVRPDGLFGAQVAERL
jgi:branched-chain amino acid transport system permease protein